MGQAAYGRVFIVGSTGALIGRDTSASICLQGSDLSRRHAMIVVNEAGAWQIEDLGSRNGTYVNGAAVAVSPLAYGDRVQLGERALFVFARHDVVEEKLLEMQKAEMVEQLAGGVAHDFLNMLAAVQNNLRFLEEEILGESFDRDEIRTCLGETESAVRRAVDLTRRLLEMSRGGEHNEARVALPALIEEVAQFCRRSMGQDLEIRTEVQPDLAVMGDSTQLHQLLMNLCLTARCPGDPPSEQQGPCPSRHSRAAERLDRGTEHPAGG